MNRQLSQRICCSGALSASHYSSDGHRPPLQFHRNTDEPTPAQGESPRMVRRPRDTDPRIGINIDNRIRIVSKTMVPLRA